MASWQRSLYAAWFGQVVGIFGWQVSLPFLPLFLQEVGVRDPVETQLWAGVLMAASPLAMTVSAPIWGMLSDRYGPKPMFLRATFTGAALMALIGLATDPWQLLVLRVLTGALTGTVTAATTLIATISPRDRLGYSLGLMQMAVYFGAAVGPLTGGTLADAIGYRSVFLLTGGILVLSGLIFMVFVESVPPQAVQGPTRAVGGQTSGMLSGLGIVARDGWLLAMIVLLLVLQLSRGAIVPVLPLFIQTLVQPGSGVATQAGYVLAAAGFASSVAAVLSGRLGDRFGYRTVLLTCTFLVGLLDVPQFFVQDTGQLLLLRIGTGLFVGGIIPTANAVIGTAAPPERRGVVFGVSQSATAFGMAVGPLLGATVAAGFGPRSAFLVTATTVCLMGIWLLWATGTGAGRWGRAKGAPAEGGGDGRSPAFSGSSLQPGSDRRSGRGDGSAL